MIVNEKRGKYTKNLYVEFVKVISEGPHMSK